MSPTTIIAPWLCSTGLLETRLYYLEEVVTVLLVLVIPFAAITVLVLAGNLIWNAGRSVIQWARQCAAGAVTAHRHERSLAQRVAGLHIRR